MTPNDPDLNAITILFQDKTALSFDLDPRLTGVSRVVGLENWKLVGNQTMESDSQQNIDGVMAINQPNEFEMDKD